MEAQWRRMADELGPAKIVLIRDPRVGLEAMVVVDNTACGPAIGGVRMALDVTLDEPGDHGGFPCRRRTASARSGARLTRSSGR